jgi:hypothetical protein
MISVKVYYDQVGNTFTVWFDDPENEFEAEETGEEIILMNNKQSAVIGFEKLCFTAVQLESLRVAFEIVK